jgi:protein TonB
VPVIRAVRATPTPTPIPVSPGVQEAKLIHKVIPVYPRLGIQIHLAGTVRLAAIIGTDGRIRELRVLSGHPILVTPAVEAVQQWVYQPTMLGTTAMEVMTEITVNFNLTRN